MKKKPYADTIERNIVTLHHRVVLEHAGFFIVYTG